MSIVGWSSPFHLVSRERADSRTFPACLCWNSGEQGLLENMDLWATVTVALAWSKAFWDLTCLKKAEVIYGSSSHPFESHLCAPPPLLYCLLVNCAVLCKDLRQTLLWNSLTNLKKLWVKTFSIRSFKIFWFFLEKFLRLPRPPPPPHSTGAVDSTMYLGLN